MIVNIPEAKSVFDRLGGVEAAYDGKTSSIDSWRKDYIESIEANRQLPPMAIFNIFVSSLLERAMKGEAFEKRTDTFKRVFESFEDVTEESVAQTLADVGYRFPSSGQAVVMSAKALVNAAGFSWPEYFSEAEKNYLNDYPQDSFLVAKYVGLKTRDLALSTFSNRFVAVDVHIIRTTLRTGLIVRGYCDPVQTASDDYLFVRNLVLKLSFETGWPNNGYSPGEIDRMLWHFGRSVCKSTPVCRRCPLTDLCLTSVQRRSLAREGRNASSSQTSA